MEHRREILFMWKTMPYVLKYLRYTESRCLSREKDLAVISFVYFVTAYKLGYELVIISSVAGILILPYIAEDDASITLFTLLVQEYLPILIQYTA